jgi:hypothetical protein
MWVRAFDGHEWNNWDTFGTDDSRMIGVQSRRVLTFRFSPGRR